MELRGCWTERQAADPGAARGTGADLAVAADHGLRPPPRDFIPIDEIRLPPLAEPAGPSAPPTPLDAELAFFATEPVDVWETRSSLFGEPE